MAGRKKRRSRAFKEKGRETGAVIDIGDAREERRKRREEEQKRKQKKKSAGKQQKEAASGRRAGKAVKRRLVYLLVLVVILAVSSFSVYNLISQKAALNEAKAKQEELQKEKEKLQQELTQVNSDEYVEQQARKQLNMIKPGELLFVVDDGSETTESGVDSQ